MEHAKAQEDQGVSPFDMVKGVMKARADDVGAILTESFGKGNVPLDTNESLRNIHIAETVYAELQGNYRKQGIHVAIASGLQSVIDSE